MASEVERLRAELKKARQAVTNKINRVQKSTGAKVGGSEFDPRRRAGIENQYNAKQLQSHITELKDFMRRGNQFAALKNGVPVTRGEAYVFERRKAAQQEAKTAYQAVMSRLETPSGLSGVQNKAMVLEGRNPSVRGPYATIDTALGDITSRKALLAIGEKMVEQSKVNYLGRQIGQGRENLNKALLVMGDNESIEELNKLSAYQFDAFWFNTNIAEAVFMQYARVQDQFNETATQKETWQQREIDEATRELGNHIKWAASLPRDRPSPRPEVSERVKGFKR
jgi:hypothetical protein